MHQRAKAACVLFAQIEVQRLHPQHVAQIKTVRAGQVRSDRRGAEPLDRLEILDAKRPGRLPCGRLFIRRQVVKQVRHPLGQLRVRTAKQQARRLKRITIVPLASDKKIDPPIPAPAAHQQFQQPGIPGKTIAVGAQPKRHAKALRQKPVAVDKLRQKPLVGAGDDQVRRVLPRQFKPALQVDRVCRPLRKERLAAEVIKHQRQFLRRVAPGLGRNGGVQPGQAPVQLGNGLDANFVRCTCAVKLSIGENRFQKTGQADGQRLLRQFTQRTQQQPQRQPGRDAAADVFLLMPLRKIQSRRRRQVRRQMPEP